MKKKSVIKNYIYNVLYQILIMIIPIVTTPYLTRVLGASNLGIYSFTISIVTYFILFGSLGVSMYGQREIAYYQDDIEKRTKIFYEIFFMRLITLGISILVFYLVFCLNGEYNTFYKILLLEIIANIVDISWFFHGLEEFKKTVIRNVFVKLISVICIFVFVKSDNDLWIYYLIYVLSTLLGNLSLWLYMPKYINKLSIKGLNLKKHIKPTITLFIPQIAIQIYTVLDKTMLGVMLEDKSEVAFYEESQKIIKILLMVATSLGTVMLPRIAAVFSKGNKEKIKEYINNSFSFIMLLAFPMMMGIILISNNFVPIFFGEGFDKVKPLLCITSPIIVLIGLSNVVGTQYLLPTKRQGKFTLSVVSGAIINFTLNYFLIKSNMSIGASIATVIAELSVTTIQFILVRKEIKFSEVFKLIYKYLLVSILMFIIALPINLLPLTDLYKLILKILVSVMSYFIILILIKDKYILKVINIIKNKIKSFKKIKSN